MDYALILKYFQTIVSVLLLITILVQNRGSGLGAGFGGSGSFHVSKRGAEKVLAQMTVVLAVLFVASSLIALFVR